LIIHIPLHKSQRQVQIIITVNRYQDFLYNIMSTIKQKTVLSITNATWDQPESLKHSWVGRREQQVQSMANATWDQPKSLKRSLEDKWEDLEFPSRQNLRRLPKHIRPSSEHSRKTWPSKTGIVKRFKPEKEIEQLLALLRDPSFCSQGVCHENPAHPIPASILCNSVPSLDRHQATNKQMPGQEMNPPIFHCTSQDSFGLDSSSSLDSLSFGDKKTQSLDRAFGGKRPKSLASHEAHRNYLFLRTASANM
jgi:mRNA-degrading endonuclease HigB of HigAB toxin-antitoxin module